MSKASRGLPMDNDLETHRTLFPFHILWAKSIPQLLDFPLSLSLNRNQISAPHPIPPNMAMTHDRAVQGPHQCLGASFHQTAPGQGEGKSQQHSYHQKKDLRSQIKGREHFSRTRDDSRDPLGTAIKLRGPLSIPMSETRLFSSVVQGSKTT